MSLPNVVFTFKQLMETTDHSCGQRMEKNEQNELVNVPRRCLEEIVGWAFFLPKNCQFTFSSSLMYWSTWTRKDNWMLWNLVRWLPPEPYLCFSYQQYKLLCGDLDTGLKTFSFLVQCCHLPVNNLVESIVERRGNSNPTVWADPCDPPSKAAKNILYSRLVHTETQSAFLCLYLVTAKLLNYTWHSL